MVALFSLDDEKGIHLNHEHGTIRCRLTSLAIQVVWTNYTTTHT